MTQYGKMFGVAGLSFFVGAFVFAQFNAGAKTAKADTQAVVRTQRLELVDSAGKVRGDWTLTNQGTPILRMLNSQGVTVADIEVKNDGPVVLLRKSAGNGGEITLGWGNQDLKAPQISLNNGTRTEELVLEGGQQPSIAFNGADGRGRVRLVKSGVVLEPGSKIIAHNATGAMETFPAQR